MEPLCKDHVLAAFRTVLEARRDEALRELGLLDEAAAAETKSSAGDKYETAREMIAQSRALQERTRAEVQAGLDWLERLPPGSAAETIRAGSLVRSDLGWHLLGALTSAVVVDGTSVQGITLSSPLGQALKGRRAGESLAWRDRPVQVHGIL